MLSATDSPPQSWSEQALQRLRELADRPVFLVFVLLAANALARPYANISHDTRLYSVQVRNQTENGAYNDDLHFRFGSQDQYSLFSRIMAPLARWVGLKAAFFLAYLASTTLFIIGLVVLVGRLLDDRFLRLASLVYLVTAPLSYGGLGLLHVHESFMTPRLLAAGPVLLGLAQLVDRRLSPRSFLIALSFMILAGLFHPLMATGGFLIWAGVLLVYLLGWRFAALATALVTAAGAAFLAVPSIAGRVLGEMDDEWRQAILHASAFNFTSQWEMRDWANVLFSGVGVLAGLMLYWKQQPGRARFFAVAGLVGVAAVAGSALAEHLPYALLLQGQPYRALWILKVLQVPLCFLLADRLLRSDRSVVRLLAFVPLGFLLASGPLSLWFALPGVVLFPYCVLVIRGLCSRARCGDWLLRSVGWSLLLGDLAWCTLRNVVFVSRWNMFLDHRDAFDLLLTLLVNIGIVPWMLLILGSTAWLMQRGLSRRAFGLGCLGLCLTVQMTFFIVPNTTYVREHGTPGLTDILFARDFLRQQAAPARMPTVYSVFGRVDYVWLELGTNSYFDWWQTGGFMFRRQTAMEGLRRAQVAGPFELDRFRETATNMDERLKNNAEQFFHCSLDGPPPTVADLARLCQDPAIDYAILKQEFPNLYAATNGRVFIYDCRQVRARLN